MSKQIGALPLHVAIIPDGNRRWAKAHGSTLEESYLLGGKCFESLLMKCMNCGIKYISVYGFSHENIHRTEVDPFIHAVHHVILFAIKAGFNVELLGDVTDENFPELLKPFIHPINNHSPFTLYILTNYSLGWDIQSAVTNAIALQAVIPNNLAKCQSLATRHVPPVDLLLRWGGNHRLSGFLPCQTNYADLYFFEKLWPEYTDDDIDVAIEWYRNQVDLHGL